MPADRRIPIVRLETQQGDVLQGKRIVVAIDEWPRSSKIPIGHYVKRLGEVGDKEAENEVLLLEHDIKHDRFSDAVLACLPTMPWILGEEVGLLEIFRNLWTLIVVRTGGEKTS